VGDAEFQKKAIGKMQDISQGGGRTVLFVSHNMGSVKALCSTGLVLKNGNIVFKDNATRSVDFYSNTFTGEITFVKTLEQDNTLANDKIKIKKIALNPTFGSVISIESGIDFELNFENLIPGINMAIGITLFGTDDTKIFETTIIVSKNYDSKIGDYTVLGKLAPFILNAGIYRVKFVFGQNQMYVLYINENVLEFEIQETFFNRETNFNKVTGICRPDLNWQLNYISND